MRYISVLTGLARLKEGEAGQAVRLLEESKAVAHGALPLAAAYNKAAPSTPAADHAEFDNDLRICVESAFTKVGSDCSSGARDQIQGLQGPWRRGYLHLSKGLEKCGLRDSQLQELRLLSLQNLLLQSSQTLVL